MCLYLLCIINATRNLPSLLRHLINYITQSGREGVLRWGLKVSEGHYGGEEEGLKTSKIVLSNLQILPYEKH